MYFSLFQIGGTCTNKFNPKSSERAGWIRYSSPSRPAGALETPVNPVV